MDYGCYFTYSSPLVFSFVKVLEIRNIFFSQKSRLHPSIGLAYTCYKAKSQWTIDIIQLLLLLLLLSSLSPPAPSVCPLKVQSWLTKWISKTHSLLLSQDNPVFILGAKGLSWGWFSCQCLSPSPKCNHLNKFPQMRCKWKCSMGLPVNLLKRNRFFFSVVVVWSYLSPPWNAAIMAGASTAILGLGIPWWWTLMQRMLEQ